MATNASRHVPWFLAPFAWFWSLLGLIIRITGRLLGAAVGFLLMAVGIMLTATLISAPIGIPLMVLGLLLMIRSVF